ncbi:MAG TPA: FkbM family methyltransferase [Gemmataceae bacterium]|nr:FkbM family methyltransferase [Gemmataceae bacterium]
MHPLKRATKACLRPLYRGLLKPICKPLLLRLRDFLTPGPATLEAVQRDVWAAHVQLQALVTHFAQLHRLAGEFGTRLQHFEGAFHETDRMLLALFKAAYPPHGEVSDGPGRPLSALYLGNDRVLATHPHWPFIYLDATDPLLTPRALTHTYEPGVRSLLERLVNPGATVVEVGASQGYHTLTLAALAGPGGRVVAFEPNPRAAGFLRQTLLCNGLEQTVSLRPEAAYHENRTLTLYLGAKDCPLSASLLPTAAGAATVQVDAVRVGDVLAAEGLRPDVVRLDAAGAEASVLDGMWSCLEAAPEVKVTFPFNIERLQRAGAAPEDLLARLAALRFRFWSAGEHGELDPITADKLLERGGEVVAARELD